MRIPARMSAVLSLFISAACGGSSMTSDETPLVDADAESLKVASHAMGASALSHGKAVTEAFVHEDPTIDTSKSAGDNGDAIAAQIQAATAMSCPSAQIVHAMGSATLSVTFPSSGCKISGVPVSGQVDIGVATAPPMVSVSFKFTTLTVGGHSLDGMIVESTNDGRAYTTQVTNLVSQEVTYNFNGTLALDSDSTGVTLDGTGSSQKSGDKYPSTFSFTGVHHTFQACYADRGMMAQSRKSDVTLRTRTVTITTTNTVLFDANTRKDGTVDVTIAVSGEPTQTKKDVKLPAYGQCPPA
jgi:signaling mucin MSB2